MLPESVHQKLKQLVNENQKIVDTIEAESKSRPAKELKSLAISQGWKEDGTPGDHKIYSHDVYFEYPNYSGYITIDDGKKSLHPNLIREELKKIFSPKQKQLILDLIDDSETRQALRTWLSYCPDQAEVSDTQQQANEITNLKQQLYTYRQQMSLLTTSDALTSVENTENRNPDQDAVDAILNQNQQLLDRKEAEINELLDDLHQKQHELTASVNKISSLQTENSNLSAELTHLQGQQQHLAELEQELLDLRQQITTLQPFQQQTQELQRQLTQAERQRQHQIEALNQQFQQVRQHLEQQLDLLNTEIQAKNTEIQGLEQQKTQLQAQNSQLTHTLEETTFQQSQLARRIRRTQKPLFISSVIVAAVVAFNPGPRILNALAVVAIPASTLAWQKRR